MKLSEQIFRGWEPVKLLADTCAAEGGELECIPRVVPRQMLLGFDAGMVVRTIEVRRTEEGKSKIEMKDYS